ncbi:MAG: PIG-L deacetylase family protein [Acidimicrobiales bacterium]
MISTDIPVPGSALAIGAHPDDIEFGAGATLAKWADAGCRVSLLICTDGSKGTWDVEADTAQLVATRQEEQRVAATQLGAIGEVVFMGSVDGELRNGPVERTEVATCIRRIRPDVILGHDPWKRYRLHPDHRHAGFLTIDAIVAARDPHFLPELDLAHHRPVELLLFEAEEIDHVETVAGYDRAKLAALESHRSQFESTMNVLGDDAGQLEAFRKQERDRLVAHGDLIDVDMGEGFKRITEL